MYIMFVMYNVNGILVGQDCSKVIEVAVDAPSAALAEGKKVAVDVQEVVQAFPVARMELLVGPRVGTEPVFAVAMDGL